MGDSGMTEEPKRQEEEAQESEENNRWDKIKEYLFNNPTFVLTLLYLYGTAFGMLYSAVLYGSFGINVFEYSELVDFLLAAFKNPLALCMAAGGGCWGLRGCLQIVENNPGVFKALDGPRSCLHFFLRHCRG
jgi:hypothetical protein